MPGTPQKTYGSRDEGKLGRYGSNGVWYPHPSAQVAQKHHRHRSEGELQISRAADAHKSGVQATSEDRRSLMQPSAMPLVVADVPYHHPAEMQVIVAKVNDVVGREKAFPIKLHAQRVASDAAINEMVSNFDELVSMLDSDINDVRKVDTPTASAMREVVEVLKDNFASLQNHILQRDSATAKNFEDYKKILTEQYGSAMALELANLHNGLSMWRQQLVEHHLDASMKLQHSVEIEANANKNIFSALQQSHNTLTLRHGLLVTEKKAADQRVIQAEKKEKVASEQHKKAKVEIDALQATIKDLEGRSGSVEEKQRLEDEIKALKGKVEALSSVKLELKSVEASYEVLQSATATQIAKAQNDSRHWQQKFIDADRIIDVKAQQLGEREASITNLRTRLVTQGEERDLYEDMLKKLGVKNKDDAKKLQVKIEELETSTRKLQQKNLDLGKNVATLKDELDTAHVTVKTLKAGKEDTDKKLEEQKAELESHANKIAENDYINRDLEAEQKKSKALEAENARLTFLATADKGALEIERKQLRTKLKEKDQEIERLEADVHRLATKVLAGGRNPDFTTGVPKAKPVEQPENFVFRKAAFDYDIVPNTNSPEYVIKQGERRIAALEDELKLYRVLMQEGNKFRNHAGIRSKLLSTGLFIAKPDPTYVNPKWYDSVSKAREEIIYSGETIAPGPEFTMPDGREVLDNTELVDYEEYI